MRLTKLIAYLKSINWSSLRINYLVSSFCIVKPGGIRDFPFSTWFNGIPV
jgi:hypothetical protein